MGLFKSSKKVSSKSVDKTPVAAAPPPVEAPAPEPEPQVVEAPPVDAFGYSSSPLVHTVSDSSFIEYQPRPPPPNGKGFVSPLSSWLEEYGSGPFLSRDGSKPQYPGKDQKDEEKDKAEKGDKEERDGDSSSSADAKDVKEVERTPRNHGGKAKESSESEFTRVKRGSARSSRREDAYEGERVRSSREGRRDYGRDYGRSEGRYSSDRDARTMSRASDSSHVSDRSYGSDHSADRVVRERESNRRSKASQRMADEEMVDEIPAVEIEDVVPDVGDDILAVETDEIVEEVVTKHEEDTAPKSEDVSEEPEAAVTEKVEKPKKSTQRSVRSSEEAEAPIAGKAERTRKGTVQKAVKPSADSEAAGADKPKKRTARKPVKPVEEVAEPLKDADEELSEAVKDEADYADDKVDELDDKKINADFDLGDELDGKKVRTLDNGSEPSESEKYTSDDKELPDKDSEMVMLKDKLKQLQQKLAEERADKLELQKKLKDRDREIFSLNKQLDKVEAQLDRYERFGVGLDGGSHHGSRASLVDQDGNPVTDREMRSADDLQLALRAFKEHSNAKLAETFKQNADLRHQVESYETLCRTIGEVLRDYEWLQQCRIVTGDLDYSRLRKAMMKLWHTGKTRAVLPVIAMVLAFGPDEVSRCRHVLNSAKQDADMVDYIPEIIEHNMDETMKRDAITVYIEAHKQLTEDTEIALYLTDRFAERYKGEWHCVVGEQYALSSCYESKVIKFKSGHRSVILWSN